MWHLKHQVMNLVLFIHNYGLETNKCRKTFIHLSMLKQIFCAFIKVSLYQICVCLVSNTNFDLQTKNFKMTAIHYFEPILWEDNNLNLVTQIWRKFFASTIPNHKLSKYIKLVDIVDVQIFGSIEDE
jgi:hypothetical protein